MKKYRPDMQALQFLRLIMTLISFAVNYLSLKFFSFNTVLMWSCISLFWFLTLVLGFVYLPVYFSNASLCVSKTAVTKTSGVFVLTKQSMRSDSIAYVSAVITPLGKYTSLNFLIIHAMGGAVLMTFLNYRDVSEIMQNLDREIKKPRKI